MNNYPRTIIDGGKTYTHAGGRDYYRIYRMFGGSANYGPCEICGGYVDTMHCITFGRALVFDDIDEDCGVGMAGDWALALGGRESKCGHLACLEGAV